jgi:DNA repair protein SbcC/Rad50
VLLTRVYLRNFRVYEGEVDLELPPGLVGVYGPNGSGKSSLLEAILWTLWGKARTTKEQVRSAGVEGDCETAVEFEHEGHLYSVRRRLSGINATPRLEARCDGFIMSEGVRDAERYIESVLGMDDGAFRASVFSEQKQLAAFSDRSPAERLRLVLRLLGITPLDAARDTARRDSRRITADHERLRGMLPDVEALRVEAADAGARAAAASAAAEAEERAAATADDRLGAAAAELAVQDQRRHEHDALMIEGRGARQELDALDTTVTDQQADLDALLASAAELAGLEEMADGLDRAEHELAALSMTAAAVAALQRAVVPPEPPCVDEAAIEGARAVAAETECSLAGLESLLQAAVDSVAHARRAADRSASLSGEADCPVCGQALGDAFEQVQAHRAQEAKAAEARRSELADQVAPARHRAEEAQAHLAQLLRVAESARRARQEWEMADRRRQEAAAALAEAWRSVLVVAPDRAHPRDPPDLRIAEPGAEVPLPSPARLARDVAQLQSRVDQLRSAAAQADRLRIRLERRPNLEAALAANQERVAVARGRLQALREKVRALAFDRAALERAAVDHGRALEAAKVASATAQRAAIDAASERARREAAATRLADAEAQHARLAELEVEARHLARVADLLGEFRNTVVASVGPRLAVQAAELFGALTDHEYDGLLVDPDSYELQINDGGSVYGLDRFSGSEIDLANLALRVAISEHIHFQSGGSVGLLVLDEVFGPLDEDRKARMLLALERLRGRFRQVLVVTHDASIKEQLPHAIEVVKLPGRRATARLVSG